MSKFINSIYAYIRPAVKFAWIFIVAIIFVLLCLYVYYSWIKPKLTKSVSSNIANMNRTSKNADIYFFHVDWCPHCIKSAPEWKKFSDSIDETVVNGITIHCHDIDCTDNSNPEISKIISQNNIQGYPTVKILFDDGTSIEFESNISQNSLATFVDTVTRPN